MFFFCQKSFSAYFFSFWRSKEGKKIRHKLQPNPFRVSVIVYSHINIIFSKGVSSIRREILSHRQLHILNIRVLSEAKELIPSCEMNGVTTRRLIFPHSVSGIVNAVFLLILLYKENLLLLAALRILVKRAEHSIPNADYRLEFHAVAGREPDKNR